MTWGWGLRSVFWPAQTQPPCSKGRQQGTHGREETLVPLGWIKPPDIVEIPTPFKDKLGEAQLLVPETQ